jgi:uncharacterized delta-60 repeat protein
MAHRRTTVFTLVALAALTALAVLAAAASAAIPTNDPIFSMTRQGAGSGTDAATGVAVAPDGTLYVCGSIATAAHKLDMTIQRLGDAPFGWSRTFDGAAHRSDEAVAIAVGPGGTVYVVGNSFNARGNRDVVLLKYSSAGTLIWGHRWTYASYSDDFVKDLVVDKYGNVVVMGRSVQTRRMHTVVLKYMANGHLAWMRLLGPSAHNDAAAAGRDLALDAAGNAYIAGTRTPSGGKSQAMLVKFSAAGAKLWDRTYRDAAHLGDGFSAICRCPTGGVFIVGWTTGLGPDTDGILMRYSAAGARTEIARLAGGAGTTQTLNDVHVDSLGRIDVCGNWTNTNSDFYAAQLTAGGTLNWSYTFAIGSGADQAKALVVDSADRVTVVGTTVTSAPKTDLYVVNFAADGTPRWQSRRAWPLPGRLTSQCLARYQSSNVWVCGSTDGGAATGLDQIVLGWGL